MNLRLTICTFKYNNLATHIIMITLFIYSKTFLNINTIKLYPWLMLWKKKPKHYYKNIMLLKILANAFKTWPIHGFNIAIDLFQTKLMTKKLHTFIFSFFHHFVLKYYMYWELHYQLQLNANIAIRLMTVCLVYFWFATT